MRRPSLAFLVLVLGPIAACQPITGELTVTRGLALELIERERLVSEACPIRDSGCGATGVRRVRADFPPGTYDASLRIQARDAMLLRLDTGRVENAELRIPIPANVHLPEKRGRFALAAGDIDQPFGIRGVMESGTSSSALTAGREHCQLDIRRRVCGHKKGSKDGRGYRCHDVFDTVYGHRPVEYRDLVETRTMVLEFIELDSPDAVARFTGSAVRRYRDFTYRGPCYAHGQFVHHGLWALP
ncbi:MAG: hypothetical protein R3174_00630 [Gammaproteobacteria bacterium]|nr:hypothetical protein [Gammaproteobacteria bacterium]